MGAYVEVRGVRIGEGVPKICVPIVGKTKEEILAAAKSFENVKKDVVEFRVDWFEGVFDFAQVENVLKELREILKNTPILFTFRTSKEGGEKEIEPEVYVELNKRAAATGLIDLVDVEAFTGDAFVKEVIDAAHESGVVVVASNHDFDKTPDKEEIVKRLRKGKCTIELGLSLSDILTNYERVADHCSNIAVCLIQVEEDGFETHEYLNEVKQKDNKDFQNLYQMYYNKYQIGKADK